MSLLDWSAAGHFAINDAGKCFFSFQSKITLKQSPTWPEPTGLNSNPFKFDSEESNKLSINFFEKVMSNLAPENQITWKGKSEEIK